MPNESIEATVRTSWLFWSGVLLRMDGHRLLKRVMSGVLENAGEREPEGKEKDRMGCLAEDRRVFGITGD